MYNFSSLFSSIGSGVKSGLSSAGGFVLDTGGAVIKEAASQLPGYLVQEAKEKWLSGGTQTVAESQPYDLSGTVKYFLDDLFGKDTEEKKQSEASNFLTNPVFLIVIGILVFLLIKR